MNVQIGVGVGSLLIAGLVLLFRFVRKNGIAIERETIVRREANRVNANKVWNELNNYRDVRDPRKPTKQVIDDAQSYFDANATGAFRSLSATQKMRVLDDPNATTAKFRALTETGKHRALLSNR